MSRPSIRLTQEVCERLLEPFASGALFLADGSLLHLKYESLADIGTFEPCADTIQKYFALKPGDAVIVNDPFAGGTLLSTITLAMMLSPSLLVLVREGFRPLLRSFKKVDEEGLRIPPTPLIQNGELLEPILWAMTSHDLAPDGFQPRVRDGLKKLGRMANEVECISRSHPHLLKTENLQAYLQECSERMQRQLNEVMPGEAQIETLLNTGESLRLKLQLSPEGLNVNFSGTKTDPHQKLWLTNGATLGAVAGALMTYLNFTDPVNKSLFNLLHVSSPLGSFLNSKYPQSTFLGMTEGTSFIAQSVLRGLQNIRNRNSSAETIALPLMVHLTFEDGRQFYDTLAAGAGANATTLGTDSASFWSRNDLLNSIEQIERKFPMSIEYSGVRSGSGGSGAKTGGRGSQRIYKLHAPAVLSYLISREKLHVKNTHGGGPGTSSEISIRKPQDEDFKAVTDERGEISLPEGTLIQASASGGMGYGTPKSAV